MSDHACTVTLSELKRNCSNCNLRDLCMPMGLSNEELVKLDTLVSQRRRIPKGEGLFRTGDDFHALYAVKTGTFKTRLNSSEGAEQVIGFQMTGEILGLDGLGSGAHMCDAVALEDSEVCIIPYQTLDDLSQQFHSLQMHFHRVMGREIVKDQSVMLLLGSMRAEQRLSAFLMNLSERQKARGFSATSMVLRMTREEIGSYLGLTIETVSRTLSKLQKEALIRIDQKNLTLLKLDALQTLATGRLH
ncbi:MAG: fumarate/nitrate reduction transcriptional regulator Fnr [Limnobacter sp.]|uniref:fumarate/nitrate reduction transcriptional regulator Fnr n=1 Tax=Limnobacter sp. TaxID=2003368 RepID=UPI00391D7A9D